MAKTSYEVVVKLTTWFILLEQIRQQATAEADLQLTESIRRNGVLQPIGARPKGDHGEVVFGHRRLRCAIAAGLTEVPCVILDKDMSESDFLALQVVENVAREGLAPFDLFQGCMRLMEANPKWSQKDLAKALSLDASAVTRIMSASKCVPAVVEAFKAGALGPSDVYAISKAEESAQSGLLALKLSGGATRDALERAARKVRATTKEPTEKLARIVCPLSTGTKITVTGAAMDLEALIESLAAVLESARKANKEQLDVKTWARVLADKARA